MLALLACKTLMQVTRKLVALCIQAHERHAGLFAQHMTCSALHKWLKHAADTRTASPDSPLSVSVWQQLQESGLLQHLAAVLAEAADELDAVTALLAAGDSTVCGLNDSSCKSSSGHLVVQRSRAGTALHAAQVALHIYRSACFLGAPAGGPRINASVGLPAAPAGARLALTMVRVWSMPQLQGAEMIATVAFVTKAAHSNMLGLTGVLHNISRQGLGNLEAPRQLPGARELLLSPDIIPCLAINVVVGLLKLDILACLEPVPGNTSAAPACNNMGSSSRSGASSSAVGCS